MRPTDAFRRNFAACLILIGTIFLVFIAAWYHQRWQSTSGPSLLAFGKPDHAYNLLFMGTDLPYERFGRNQQPDVKSFAGRSDTIMLVHIDPAQGKITGLHIPRDTTVHINGYGHQKINAANAIGGPQLAAQAVTELLGVPVDHYVVLNVHGLVEAVNELGGITLDVPKKMSYIDWTAKLRIALEPGEHTLTGNQAMGFVRFRHDELGDIGRVQRQELFMRAFAAKIASPSSWQHIPRLLSIMRDSVLTDLSDMDMFQAFNLARSLPRDHIQFAMLPGRFGRGGSWVIDANGAANVVARMNGYSTASGAKDEVSICVMNVSSYPELGSKIAQTLRRAGYRAAEQRTQATGSNPKHRTKIIAQQGNDDEAKMVQSDLGNKGDIINASVGDIYSKVTVLVDDDLQPLFGSAESTKFY